MNIRKEPQLRIFSGKVELDVGLEETTIHRIPEFVQMSPFCYNDCSTVEVGNTKRLNFSDYVLQNLILKLLQDETRVRKQSRTETAYRENSEGFHGGDLIGIQFDLILPGSLQFPLPLLYATLVLREFIGPIDRRAKFRQIGGCGHREEARIMASQGGDLKSISINGVSNYEEAQSPPEREDWLCCLSQADYMQRLEMIQHLSFETATTKIMATPDGEYLNASASSPDLYWINLEQGRFLSPLSTRSPALNVVTRSKLHGLVACGGEDGAVECFGMRSRSSVGRINAVAPPGDLDQEVSAIEFDGDGGFMMAVGSTGGKVLNSRKSINMWVAISTFTNLK
ncbi:hypothetical protein SAY86_012266 [Trapa natans]|uniref:Nucleolar protein 10-like N-terminal domain-containing protein n=1 Tax=Trapa natans TaxID=22666 RepID=A0AAN7M9R1_TRANT|nr:hypothetical protein SAY86_012266 [Trapa natans]